MSDLGCLRSNADHRWPPYLYSWFHDACGADAHDYLIQVGWHSPAGPLDDVWQWYDVSDS